MKVDRVTHPVRPMTARSHRKSAAVAEDVAPRDAVELASLPLRDGKVTGKRNALHAATASSVAAAAGPAAAVGVSGGLKTGFVDSYLTPSNVLTRARALAAKYPDLVELVVRPYQTHGYDGTNEDLRGPAPLYY